MKLSNQGVKIKMIYSINDRLPFGKLVSFSV